jgi:hypothetical protein
MWVDEMVVYSPLPTRPRTTSQKIIIERDHTDHFIALERTLEPDLPSSLPIEISSEIYEISYIYSHMSIYFMAYPVDEKSLPYATKLEHHFSMEDDLISRYLDISIVTMPLTLHRTLCAMLSIPVSELCESLAYCRIKVSMGLLCEDKHELKHLSRLRIEHSSTREIGIVQPVCFSKSRVPHIEASQILFYGGEEYLYLIRRIDAKCEMCPDDLEVQFLHSICLS